MSFILNIIERKASKTDLVSQIRNRRESLRGNRGIINIAINKEFTTSELNEILLQTSKYNNPIVFIYCNNGREIIKNIGFLKDIEGQKIFIASTESKISYEIVSNSIESIRKKVEEGLKIEDAITLSSHYLAALSMSYVSSTEVSISLKPDRIGIEQFFNGFRRNILRIFSWDGVRKHTIEEANSLFAKYFNIFTTNAIKTIDGDELVEKFKHFRITEIYNEEIHIPLLLEATRSKKRELIKYLIEEGFNPFYRATEGSKSPIEESIDNLDVESIKILTKYSNTQDGIEGTISYVDKKMKHVKTQEDRMKIINIMQELHEVREQDHTRVRTYKEALTGTKELSLQKEFTR